jgi:large subunit ribosomal protein L24
VASMKIKRDDTVKVISGKDRGKTGRVLRVDPRRKRVFVEGLNMRKRHERPRALPGTQRGAEVGGVVESEGPIHISNVMLLDPSSGQPTRLSIRREGGRKVRVARRSGEVID